MAVNETIITGEYFRRLIDKSQKLWQRISFWTKASDVEFNDGKNAEEKIIELNNKIVELQRKINDINNSLPYKITFNGTTMTVTDDTRV